ncbi:little elongation complex subunit 2-like isoform X2 [Homarus americanus]|uniref:little elongation complex subunit 2-like isoform X2 n=1 Tax=Homarus americanus TaxID=6706 RepID=UPI001C4683CE|nr:little elongation complex subunit 2-like isoform X2 [Homarus americanus]
MDLNEITFIPELFKQKSKGFDPVVADDPFISYAVLKDCCSLFASGGPCIPNYVTKEPIVSNIIQFSDDVWNDIAKGHKEREKREREAEKELEKEKEKEEAVAHQIKKKLDSEIDGVFNKHCFFLKKPCPVLIPYKSSLTHDEHEAYLRAFLKFKIRAAKTAAETAEYQHYLRLQNRVYEEQNCFMQFSHQVARLQMTAYNKVPDVITNYIDEYVQHRCKRSCKYESSYVDEQQIPICPQDPKKRFNSLCFTHIGHLLSLGSIPWIKIPNCHVANKLLVDESVSIQQPPAVDKKKDLKDILYKTPVSKDHNAAYLAQKHEANIVISSSALKIIADNYGPNFDKEWDIPVEVKSYPVKDADGSERNHRVVFIDKPMVKKTWTPMEKKQLFYKKSALASLTEIKRVPFFRMKSPLGFQYEKKEQTECTQYDDDFLDLTSTANHDTFGAQPAVVSPISKSPKKKRMAKASEAEKSPKKKGMAKASEAEKLLPVVKRETNSTDESCNPLLIDVKIENEKDKNIEIESHNELGSSYGKIEKERKGNKNSKKSKTMNSNPSKINNESGLQKTTIKREDTRELQPNNSSKSKYTEPPGCSSGGGVLENLLDMQESLFNSAQASNPQKLEKSKGSPTSHIEKPWSGTLHTEWQEHTQRQNCPAWSGINVHYQLFSLDFSSSDPGNTLQPFRIIVRHNLHGLSRFRSKKESSQAYIVYPKPESQAYFGCEVNTLSEIVQQWIHLLVRPNTTLLQDPIVALGSLNDCPGVSRYPAGINI